MNGKMESIKINIPSITKRESGTNFGGSSISYNAWLQNLWDFCKEDSGCRLIFAMKVGVAVLLVSFLILFRAPYQVFGPNIVWAILTAVLVFEYTVGATFNRGFNRALGSLLAGILAIAVAQTALSCGHVAEPFIIGFSIFLLVAITSLMKMWPSLVQYEYGFRVVQLTYCLIIVSGYRMGNPITTMIDRLYSIAIGGIISILVNVLVYPIWAGEQLHNELVKNFNSLADSLQECVKKYLDDGLKKSKFNTAEIDAFQDEVAYKRCQSTINSGPKLETLANSAKWEPPHGRFMQFLYPWSQYVKVGAVLRHCAYEVMALHSIVHSEIQAPYNLRVAFRSEIEEASNQAAELVRILGRDISGMKCRPKNSHIKRVHSSTERLQHSMHLHYSYLLTTTSESPVPDNPSNKPLSKLSYTLYHIQDQTGMVDFKCLEKNSNVPCLGTIQMQAEETECNYQETMRKQLKRLHSWPSREVDAFEEMENGRSAELVPRNRMKALKSTEALSLANFTSSLVEFVARVDHLIEAVDKLSEMAKFKPQGL